MSAARGDQGLGDAHLNAQIEKQLENDELIMPEIITSTKPMNDYSSRVPMSASHVQLRNSLLSRTGAGA